MKTIKAIFTKEKQAQPTARAYSFNTTLDVQVGDLLKSPDYEGKLLRVVSIEDDVYRFFSYKTGELFKEPSFGCGNIKMLSNETKIMEETTVVDDYNGF